jgi:hypothetical protein
LALGAEPRDIGDGGSGLGGSGDGDLGASDGGGGRGLGDCDGGGRAAAASGRCPAATAIVPWQRPSSWLSALTKIEHAREAAPVLRLPPVSQHTVAAAGTAGVEDGAVAVEDGAVAVAAVGACLARCAVAVAATTAVEDASDALPVAVAVRVAAASARFAHCAVCAQVAANQPESRRLVRPKGAPTGSG